MCVAATKLVSTGWANSTRTRNAAQLCAARARASRPGKRKFLPAEKSKSGFSQAIILPGLSSPSGIGLALERELDCVGLLHAALLEGVAVGVEDHRAHRFVLGDDLVEPRFGRELHQRQAREPYPAVEADDLQMPSDLIAVAVVDSLDQPERALAGIADLQVSDAGIDP